MDVEFQVNTTKTSMLAPQALIEKPSIYRFTTFIITQ